MNKRMRIGNYFYIWHDYEGKTLSITQMLGRTPMRQVAFHIDETAEITYYGYFDHKNKSKVVTLSKECLLFDEFADFIKNLAPENPHYITLQDEINKGNNLTIDRLNKFSIKFDFNFKNMYETEFNITSKKENILELMKKSFKKLTDKQNELGIEL